MSAVRITIPELTTFPYRYPKGTRNRTPVLPLYLHDIDDRSLTTPVWTRTKALPIFVMLQCLDVLTTLIFLSKGVAEGNALLVWALPYAHSPWIGLVAAKLIATSIGYYCYRNSRITALRLANAGYFLVIAWNLATIAAVAIAH